MVKQLGWRPMMIDDLSGVMRIAAAAFPDHHEDVECFAERLALSPSLCFVLHEDSDVKGYLVAYPWPSGSIPPLNKRLGKLPEHARSVFLHDLAVHPDASSGGHAKAILPRLVERARAGGAKSIALVAVNTSVGFWRANDFQIVDGDGALREKLAGYGEDARYMIRSI